MGATLFSQKHFSSFNSLKIKQHAFFLSSSSSAKSRIDPHPIPTETYKTFSSVQKPSPYENVSDCKRLLLLVAVALTRFKKGKPNVIASARYATIACCDRIMEFYDIVSASRLSAGNKKSASRDVRVFFIPSVHRKPKKTNLLLKFSRARGGVGDAGLLLCSLFF
jgi:hypothetical protein